MMFVGDIIPIFFVESKKIKSYRIDGAKMPFDLLYMGTRNAKTYFFNALIMAFTF